MSRIPDPSPTPHPATAKLAEPLQLADASPASASTAPARPARSQSLGPALPRGAAWVALATLLLWCTASAQAATPPLHGWGAGTPATFAAEDLNPNIRDAPWFQSWDYWVWTDEGDLLFIQFTTSSFGFGIERKGSARVILIDLDRADPDAPQGEDGILRFDRGFDWPIWGWTEEGFRLHFRDSVHQLSEDGTLLLRAVLHETRIEMELVPEAPFLAPGRGYFEAGWERHRYFLRVLPRARAYGRIGVREGREGPFEWRDFQGLATFQATRSDAMPTSLGQMWFRFSALRDDGLTLSAGGARGPEDGGGADAVWLYAGLDGVPLLEDADVRIVYSGWQEREYNGLRYRIPSGYRMIASAGDDRVEVDVRHLELVAWDALLTRVSRMLRAIISRLLAPIDLEYAAEYDARILIDGVESVVSGRGWSTLNFPR